MKRIKITNRKDGTWAIVLPDDQHMQAMVSLFRLAMGNETLSVEAGDPAEKVEAAIAILDALDEAW